MEGEIEGREIEEEIEGHLTYLPMDDVSENDAKNFSSRDTKPIAAQSHHVSKHYLLDPLHVRHSRDGAPQRSPPGSRPPRARKHSALCVKQTQVPHQAAFFSFARRELAARPLVSGKIAMRMPSDDSTRIAVSRLGLPSLDSAL
jgi:hypothetical protein